MTEEKMKAHAASLAGLPVKGYTNQTEESVARVNAFKETEERILRECEKLRNHGDAEAARWASIAFTHFQEGFMCLNRAVFKPKRLALQEDDKQHDLSV
jgi:hypothetical protein